MRQHHKKIQTSGKHKRRNRWVRGLEILKTMEKPSPYTKAIRRKLFAEARKTASKESK